MNNTGRHSEKSGYLVIMLLVVGLTAFSHSMNELSEIHHLTLDASRLVTQWSGNVSSSEIPQVPVHVVKIEKRESCQRQQSVELPSLNEPTEPSAVAPDRPQQGKVQKIERRAIAIPSKAEIARLKKLPRFEFNADEFEVHIPSVQFPEAGELPTSADMPSFTFKAKARRHNPIRINPRDRELLLKSLNRSINLRITG